MIMIIALFVDKMMVSLRQILNQIIIYFWTKFGYYSKDKPLVRIGGDLEMDEMLNM